MDKMTVGVIGCGSISKVYFENMCNVYDVLNVKACADLDVSKAEKRAAEFKGVKVVGVDDIFSDPDIDIVVNLTIPQAHYELNKRALMAGKHAYCEKPLSLTREGGEELVAIAKEKNLIMGCAPDTIFGSGIQTARRLIDEGIIGAPIAAKACWLAKGHEFWHPSPEYYYKKGAGPLLDMGPYYLTALTYLLGGVESVCGMAKKSFEKREMHSEPLKGKVIDVDVPTHIEGILNMECGVIATLSTSFDIKKNDQAMFEIYGTNGSMKVPNPNAFDDATQYFVFGESEDWQEAEPLHTLGLGRGAGVADMAFAALRGRKSRISAELASHVLDVMLSILESAETEKFVKIKSDLERPEAVPQGLAKGILDS